LGIDSVISSEAPRGAGRDAPYWNCIGVEIKRVDGSYALMHGVVFGSTPHIVRVDEYADVLAFRPEAGQILTFRNADRPGLVLQVLELLAHANINVASFNVTRLQQNQTALCFVDLDEPIPTNVLNSLRSVPTLSHVASIQL
jgi:D-3-phosphoglycerate dehydrogenase